MTHKSNRKEETTVMRNRILFIALIAITSFLLGTLNLNAQSPAPSPATSSSADTVTLGGYNVTSSIELGVRGLRFDGSDEKYRSDLNYRPGFRIFDSSFRMETENGKGKMFDSLLVTTSGWSADPSGFVRVNMDKSGAYSFTANVRRVNLVNRVSNLILGFHKSDTHRSFGDFDLTVFPESENLRLRFGVSFNRDRGDRGYSYRTRDVFPITEKINSNTIDMRAGIDTKLAGFNMSFTAGLRRFDDRSKYVIDSRQPGFAGSCFFGVCFAADTNFINQMERQNPNDGDTKYGSFSLHRTFAKKLDLTGRFIYSVTDREFNIFDNVRYDGQLRYTNATGGSSTSPDLFVDSDIYEINGRAKRPQARGDVGLTYAVTDNFRISNTFTFDQYSSYADSNYYQKLTARCQAAGTTSATLAVCPAAGAPFVAGLAGAAFLDTRTLYWYSYGFKRFTNTIEGDYQFNNRFAINLGYRFTHRQVSLAHVNRIVDDLANRSLTSFTTTTADDDEEENSAHVILFGTKIKPTKSWSIYADGEHGEADNAFIRLANYNYTNFRVRSNWHYKQFAFNVSGIIRNNENPSQTVDANTGVPLGAPYFVANVRSRIFSAYVDYAPDPRWTLSSGYTYHFLTSKTDILVPSLGQGFSEYYVRDNYAFVDVSARPTNRISFYASYRFDTDKGQGDRVASVPQNIISSYPFTLHTPEVRVSVKLTKNIDWNVGYQYNNYKERLDIGYFSLNNWTGTGSVPYPGTNFLPNQNYRAHLPYTSLRIYFGGADR